jgi:hypothetical protein
MSSKPFPYYSPRYKDDMFLLWYKLGKPSSTKFSNHALPNENGDIPFKGTIDNWIEEDWGERAAKLDQEIMQKIEEEVIAEKMTMLKQHTEIARNIQDMAIEYLETHKDQMTPSTAVRMLIEGIRIERESRGMPEVLENLSNASDEKLLKQIENLATRLPTEITPHDAEIDDLGNGYGEIK